MAWVRNTPSSSARTDSPSIANLVVARLRGDALSAADPQDSRQYRGGGQPRRRHQHNESWLAQRGRRHLRRDVGRSAVPDLDLGRMFDARCRRLRLARGQERRNRSPRVVGRWLPTEISYGVCRATPRQRLGRRWTSAYATASSPRHQTAFSLASRHTFAGVSCRNARSLTRWRDRRRPAHLLPTRLSRCRVELRGGAHPSAQDKTGLWRGRMPARASLLYGDLDAVPRSKSSGVSIKIVEGQIDQGVIAPCFAVRRTREIGRTTPHQVRNPAQILLTPSADHITFDRVQAVLTSHRACGSRGP